MTLPYERRWAINNTKQFLVNLGTNEELPEEVRKEAWRNLKHYPGEYHMEEARKAAPEVFGDWEDMNHDLDTIVTRYWISCPDLTTRETKHHKVEHSIYVYIKQLEHSLEKLKGSET